MSRIARVVFPGVPHHVTQRGNRRAEALRRLPWWVWLAGAIFFPAGIFAALGIARAIKPWKAVWLAVASFFLDRLWLEGGACVADLSTLIRMYVALGGLSCLGLIGIFQYFIGSKCGLWTARGRRIWKAVMIVWLCWLGLAIILIGVTVVLNKYFGFDF
jgi:hypothetical protein